MLVTMLAAGPAPMVIVLLVALANPVDVNCRVLAPIVPPMLRPLNPTTPEDAPTIAVPPSAPPPDAIAAVTFALLPVTVLSKASLIATDGWVPNATPALAVLEGC